MKVTEERTKEIHAAMSKAQGDLFVAAKLLDMLVRNLKIAIRDTPDLDLRWGDGKPRGPTPIETLSRDMPTVVAPPSGVPSLPPAEQITEMLRRENTALLKKGLTGIGLSPEELEEAMALQALHNRHIMDSFQVIGGGVTKCAIKLLTQRTKLEQRLEKTRENLQSKEGAERQVLLLEEDTLLRRYLEICGEIRKMSGVSNEYLTKMALIKYNRDRKPDGPMRSAKPGYSNVTEMPTQHEAGNDH